MIAALRADLVILARDTGFGLMRVAYLVVLLVTGLFLGLNALEGTGPVAPGDLMLSRLVALQVVMVLAIAPWVVCRMMHPPSGSGMVDLLLATGTPPWRAILARLLASTIYASSLLLLSLPVVYVAYLMGASSMAEAASSYLFLFIWLVSVQVVALYWSLLQRDALRALPLSYLTIFVAAVLHQSVSPAVGATISLTALSLLGLGGGLWLWRCGSPQLRHRRA